MRKAIRQRLIYMIPEFDGRVLDAYMPTPSTVKPYAVLKFGGEVQSNIRYGFDLPVEVWPYVEMTKFANVDMLASKIVSALNRVDLVSSEGQGFRLRYVGSGEDFYDHEWRALTRVQRFETEIIR